MSALALFDLDHTLVAEDTDALWGRFLVERGALDGDAYEREKQRFLAEYRDGKLDIDEFIRFALVPYARHDTAQLVRWRDEFVRETIRPHIPNASLSLVNRHREAGHTLVLITATNDFLSAPIAELLAMDHLLATPLEKANGGFTGRTAGPPCFREGKLFYVNRWLEHTGGSLEPSWFYSDSHNDLPLLERVTHPVAVDPDDRLREIAIRRRWPVLSLHHGEG